MPTILNFLLVSVALISLATPACAGDPNLCATSKLKSAKSLAGCQFRAQRRAAKRGGEPDPRVVPSNSHGASPGARTIAPESPRP